MFHILPSLLHCVYVLYMYVCIYVCMYVCIYVLYMYVCMYVHMYIYVCMYICTVMYVCIYVCMYVCLQRLEGGRTGDVFPSEEALIDNLLNFAGTPKVI